MNTKKTDMEEIPTISRLMKVVFQIFLTRWLNLSSSILFQVIYCEVLALRKQKLDLDKYFYAEFCGGGEGSLKNDQDIE